ncbi:hypothetical protein N0V90_004476 [Kalmusia sp. IMI 367209]|nr:hypothetical protein N0V90_004476 [Kalmusia sp. IMI 367209]
MSFQDILLILFLEGDVEKRIDFHSLKGESKRIGERIAVAVIDASGLVPITICAEIQERIQTTEVDDRGLPKVKLSQYERKKVSIPAWVHEDAFVGHEEESAIPLDKLDESKIELWLSITELRYGEYRIRATWLHDYEWLACGAIPKTRIIKVMPFDGKKLHKVQGTREVRSEDGFWVWDWEKSMWLLDPKHEGKEEEKDAQSQNDTQPPTIGTPKKRKFEIESSKICHMQKRSRLLDPHHTTRDSRCNMSCSVCCPKGDSTYSDLNALDLAI